MWEGGIGGVEAVEDAVWRKMFRLVGYGENSPRKFDTVHEFRGAGRAFCASADQSCDSAVISRLATGPAFRYSHREAPVAD